LLRYRAKWVCSGMHENLAKNAYQGVEACVCHLTAGQQPGAPQAIPCRAAIVTETYRSGDVFFVHLELKNFWVAADDSEFTLELSLKFSTFPTRSATGALEGTFLDRMPSTATRTSEINDWELLIDRLHNHAAFAKHPFFYYVIGIYRRTSANRRDQDEVQTRGQSFRLKADSAYVVNVRTKAFPGPTDRVPFWLLVDSEQEIISFTSPKRLSIDAPQDVKEVHFRTGNTTHEIHSTITFLSQREASEQPDIDKAVLDFDLRVVNPRNLAQLFIRGVLLGTLLSVQGILVLLNTHSSAAGWGTYVILWCAGVLAGLVATFNLRKL
jgi:hypothetical protein